MIAEGRCPVFNRRKVTSFRPALTAAEIPADIGLRHPASQALGAPHLVDNSLDNHLMALSRAPETESDGAYTRLNWSFMVGPDGFEPSTSRLSEMPLSSNASEFDGIQASYQPLL
jgi:hypothetical protein